MIIMLHTSHKIEFTGSPTQMRAMYEHGYSLLQIMEMTGKAYIEVRTRLLEAGTTLLTGGPHATDYCRHDHSLAGAHARGECQHPATPGLRPRTKRNEVPSHA
jgi:hypothetical protein